MCGFRLNVTCFSLGESDESVHCTLATFSGKAKLIPTSVLTSFPREEAKTSKEMSGNKERGITDLLQLKVVFLIKYMCPVCGIGASVVNMCI